MRILIVKLSSLGDLFHALPAVHALRTGTGAAVDWVVQREYADLAGCFRDVDRVIAFPRRGVRREGAAFLRALRAQRYDLVIDLQGLLKSALVTVLARGGKRIGPSFHREGARLFYNAVAGPRNRDRHAVEQNLDTVRYLGLDASPRDFPVDFPERDPGGVRPRVGVVPASRWSSKNWPAACYIDVLQRLRRSGDLSIHLFGSRESVEAGVAIEEALGGELENRVGKTRLPDLGGYLARLDLLISNDSGPIHMAAAAGTAVLAIFGPTDPARTGPYGPAHRVIEARLPCRPCFSR
ncbi:MAG: glycosyltransferase family 9 protein, partial [Lentisphaerae bacterium]|nr:glycosyltransferase family 9 protein [Lentisphaerota bacterium]